MAICSALLSSQVDTSQFRFHEPDGFEADYAGLTDQFKSYARH
jgi:hypothetical protein